MNDYTPSYNEYNKIISAAKATHKIMDFHKAENADSFLIIRHDVEFSLTKAARIAEIENANGVASTFFIQVGSDAYNPMSDENRSIIRYIHKCGHEIGLHYRQSCSTNPGEEIVSQAKILEQIICTPVTCFSCHRPQKDTSYETIQADGMINAYSSPFFTRTEDTSKAEIKYISDSKFRWNYGYPDIETLQKHAKVQLLIHPFSWSETGESMGTNIAGILREKKAMMRSVLQHEFSRYSEIKGEE